MQRCDTASRLRSFARSAKHGLSMIDDQRVAFAAREFWKARDWLDMYLRGFVPSEYDFPEYYKLRDAINGHTYSRRPAPRMSWRWKLARWIVRI